MGRHERRSSIAQFRREAARCDLTTYLVAANVDLSRWPLLSNGVAHWRGQILSRHPYCPACKRKFSDGALPGAFLLTRTTLASAVSVTGFCTACIETLTFDEVEAHCQRVLKSIIPNGVFEPLAGRDRIEQHLNKEGDAPCR
jgi:hypothetical protein